MNEVKYVFGTLGILLLLSTIVCFSIVLFGETTHTRNVALSMTFITFIIGSIFVVFGDYKNKI